LLICAQYHGEAEKRFKGAFGAAAKTFICYLPNTWNAQCALREWFLKVAREYA
jgi:hypothetical protein